MDSPAAQRLLSDEQVEAFHHDQFVKDQTRHFMALVGSQVPADKVVVDVGGGCGFFAQRLAHLAGHKVKVIDMDLASVAACHRAGIDAVRGDALIPRIEGNESIVCFNLILHHLIAATEQGTRRLQRAALEAWCRQADAVFVNEYIYESYAANLSGWLIFQITKSRVLSWIGRKVSAIVPAFRANTFGVGVRFRAHREWLELFSSAGYELASSKIGTEERVSPPLRLLLIRRIRRDSFLLRPRTSAQTST